MRTGFAASQKKIHVLTVVSGAFSGAGRRISRRLKSFGLWARALAITSCACVVDLANIGWILPLLKNREAEFGEEVWMPIAVLRRTYPRVADELGGRVRRHRHGPQEHRLHDARESQRAEIHRWSTRRRRLRRVRGQEVEFNPLRVLLSR